MVPIDTRQSILDEPSRGSKHTIYLPCQRRETRWHQLRMNTIKHTCTHKHMSSNTQARTNTCTPTCFSGSTMMAFSFSSDTRTQEVNEDLIMLMTRSLESTSSFFTWSPVTLMFPAMPYLYRTWGVEDRLVNRWKAIGSWKNSDSFLHGCNWVETSLFLCSCVLGQWTGNRAIQSVIMNWIWSAEKSLIPDNIVFFTPNVVFNKTLLGYSF